MWTGRARHVLTPETCASSGLPPVRMSAPTARGYSADERVVISHSGRTICEYELAARSREGGEFTSSLLRELKEF